MVDDARETEQIDQMIRMLAIKAADTIRPPPLSGGNQQKVVIAKWLMTGPDHPAE